MKKSKDDFDYSKTSGIHGAMLRDVTKYTCQNCENEVFDLGDAQEIARAFVEILVSQETFPRQALKFVIEQVFEESVFEFAVRVKSNPSHIRELRQSKKIMSLELSHRIKAELVKWLHLPNGLDIKIEF